MFRPEALSAAQARAVDAPLVVAPPRYLLFVHWPVILFIALASLSATQIYFPEQILATAVLDYVNATEVRTSSDATITELHVGPGSYVTPGTLLATLQSPELSLTVSQLRARLVASATSDGPSAALGTLPAEFEAAASKLANLNVRSPVSGRVASAAARVNAKVLSGEVLIRIVPHEAHLQFLILATPETADALSVGQQITFSSPTLSRSVIRGTVANISPTVLSSTQVKATLDSLFADGLTLPPASRLIEAHLDLPSRAVVDSAMVAGTPSVAHIVVRRRTLLQRLLADE